MAKDVERDVDIDMDAGAGLGEEWTAITNQRALTKALLDLFGKDRTGKTLEFEAVKGE